MKIKPFISAQRVLLEFAAATPQAAAEALIEPLVTEGIITDPALFIADLLKREQQSSTLMDNGIGLPHARSAAVTRVGLVVALAGPGGVAFYPDRAQECRLAFCIAVPSFAPTAHMPLLRCIAGFARDEQKVQKLLACKTAGAAVRLLANFHD